MHPGSVLDMESAEDAYRFSAERRPIRSQRFWLRGMCMAHNEIGEWEAHVCIRARCKSVPLNDLKAWAIRIMDIDPYPIPV